MKLLLDSCIWGRARPQIEAAGHDVVWAGDWTLDPGDEEILSRAHSEHRTIVTLDKDFGERAVAQGRSHSGVIGLVGVRATDQARTCLAIVDRFGLDLESGSLITVEPGRVRVRLGERKTG